jgi:hypothetical protein
MVLCAGALAASSLAPASAATGAPAYTYARHYLKGQVSLDNYTENETGAETALITASARLKSYIRGGIGGEQVKWFELTKNGQAENAQARTFPPYDLSLDPNATNGLALPNTQDAGDLQGPIDDLGTFYVGLSTAVGIDSLHQPGQSVEAPTLLSGTFSNATTPVGQDLTQLTTTLTSLTAQQATFTSSYQVPPGGGLTLTEPFMNTPVCGSPSNFELVQQRGPADYLALWGCEQFTVTTVVDRASGQILSAQMSNPLQLNFTSCQDQALTMCTPIEPATLLRVIQLTKD